MNRIIELQEQAFDTEGDFQTLLEEYEDGLSFQLETRLNVYTFTDAPTVGSPLPQANDRIKSFTYATLQGLNNRLGLRRG